LSNGTLYLDVSHNFQDRRPAFLYAHQNNQISLWHVDAGKELYTMTDQLKPRESSGKPIEEPDAIHPPTERDYFDTNKMSVDEIAQIVWDNRE